MRQSLLVRVIIGGASQYLPRGNAIWPYEVAPNCPPIHNVRKLIRSGKELMILVPTETYFVSRMEMLYGHTRSPQIVLRYITFAS